MCFNSPTRFSRLFALGSPYVTETKHGHDLKPVAKKFNLLKRGEYAQQQNTHTQHNNHIRAMQSREHGVATTKCEKTNFVAIHGFLRLVS